MANHRPKGVEETEPREPKTPQFKYPPDVLRAMRWVSENAKGTQKQPPADLPAELIKTCREAKDKNPRLFLTDLNKWEKEFRKDQLALSEIIKETKRLEAGQSGPVAQEEAMDDLGSDRVEKMIHGLLAEFEAEEAKRKVAG